MTGRPVRILVAMSGGVDSAVAAHLLLREGHGVEAAYIRTWLNEDELGDCPAGEDIVSAEKTCGHLGIPFRVVNLVRDYRERVVDYLVEGYRMGITPNPDVMCNREMKFGVFARIAREEGFDGIATGHYCRATHHDGLRVFEGVDPEKGQAYFLALTRREDLHFARFPVGVHHKREIREIARQAGLPNADRKDSQGICFLGKVRINEFLSEFIEDRPGEIVDTDGTVRGEHRGLHRFTIGQRRGIGVPSNTDHEAFVVVAKDFSRNRLVVGFDSPTTPDLYARRVVLGALNWISPDRSTDGLRMVTRYRDPPAPGVLRIVGEDALEFVFDRPQRALAQGQVGAFFRDEELVGGGIYRQVLPE